MDYRRIFDPRPLKKDFRTKSEKASSDAEVADRRDGKVYLYDKDIVLAVNVALATGRPMLVRGTTGCGKSSLAYNVARCLKRRYYEFVVTARRRAEDLLWGFDAVRRLADAQVQRPAPTQGRSARGRSHDQGLSAADLPPINRYIEPGVLWWIFDRDSAMNRGYQNGKIDPQSEDSVIWKPQRNTARAVLLIDEIDKADPDVPNDLLIPLGSMEFNVREIDLPVRFAGAVDGKLTSYQDWPLIIITTNQERELPLAFLRRCVILDIKDPDGNRCREIAKATHGSGNTALYDTVWQSMQSVVGSMGGAHRAGRKPGIAEYLDAVRACLRLGVDKRSETLDAIVKHTMWKGPKKTEQE